MDHTPSRFSTFTRAAAAIVLTTAMAWHVGVQAQGPSQSVATQSSSDQGVTVKVTPKAMLGAEWEFAVVLDTHSADLSDDLAATSVLVVDGQELRPTAWVGAAPGGHHRQGVLKFPAPQQPAKSISLRIQRPGESAPRMFRWDGDVSR